MPYTVLPLQLDRHREALARLWAENMSDGRIAAAVGPRMRWLYEAGPSPRVTTVVCRDDASGEVVGCGSFFQRETWVAGARHRSGILCDFAVTRAHRVAGVAVAIQRALIDAARAAGIALLYGHPNEKSIAVFKRVGYQVLGETTAWAKPLRSGPLVGRVLGAGGAARLVALPIDTALRAFDQARAAASPLAGRTAVVERVDPRFDELWARARSRFGVAGDQSAAYLRWRYGGFATDEIGILGLFPREEGRLLAFAVWARNGPKAVVCDLFGDHLELSAEPLLLHLGAHLRARGAESLSLSYLGPPSFAVPLRSVGFIPRPGRRPVVVHPGGLDATLRHGVLDPSAWFMLEGELDI